jgi:hypothetical protein
LFGGLAWHDVQLRAASGEAARWQTVQVGPTLVTEPVSKWQGPQAPLNVVDVTA